MPVWVRGEEEAWLTSPFLPQKLAITALGTSASTGAKGLEGDIAYFESFDALVAAPDPQVKGKIAFIAHQMAPAQDGSRSEEHTSELQSLMSISYAVFCLKKKKYKNLYK